MDVFSSHGVGDAVFHASLSDVAFNTDPDRFDISLWVADVRDMYLLDGRDQV
jgi:hypothetical protein